MKTVWMIGRFDLPDANGIARELDALSADGAACCSFRTPGEAVASEANCPDLIVVVQHRPREFSSRETAALIAAQPLAACVAALGPWCASSARSERLWPDSVTVPICEAVGRLRRQREAIAGTINRLPLTASRDEAVLFDLTSAPEKLRGLTVSIVTADRAFGALLSDVVTDRGAETAPLNALNRAGVVLWDVTTDLGDAISRLEAMRRGHPDRRIVAITALPTAADAFRLREAGVAALVPKPFVMTTLTSTLAAVQAGS